MFTYAGGAQDFVVANTISSVILVTLNGAALTPTSDYTFTGSTVTIVAPNVLENGNEVTVTYTFGVSLGLAANYYTDTQVDSLLANKLSNANNLSELADDNTALNNLLLTATGNSSTHNTDGANLAIDYTGTRKHTLTLDANINQLSFTNLPDNAEFIPVILRIEQNAITGYDITSILNLDNSNNVFPDFSTIAGENTEWYIYKSTNGIRIFGSANII